MVDFYDIQFPIEICDKIIQESCFTNQIANMQNGKEIRSSVNNACLKKYTLEMNHQSFENYKKIDDFFHITHGSRYGFLIDDPLDNYVNLSLIGKGDDVSVAFKVCKYYQFENCFYSKNIDKIKTETLEVFINNVLIDKSEYELSGNQIIFKKAPKLSESICVNCGFFTTARFTNDQLKASFSDKNNVFINPIEVIEIII